MNALWWFRRFDNVPCTVIRETAKRYWVEIEPRWMQFSGATHSPRLVRKTDTLIL
jgi:hypothetical protein